MAFPPEGEILRRAIGNWRPFVNGTPGRCCAQYRTAENGFATSSGVSKSAKVVLVPLHSDYDSLIRGSGAALG